MIALGQDVRVYLCTEPTDMRRSFDGLAAQVQATLALDPFCGHWFVFRNRKGDRIKALWWDGTGMALFYKRLDEGTFPWPKPVGGSVTLSAAELTLLIDGMDYRRLTVIPRKRPTSPS